MTCTRPPSPEGFARDQRGAVSVDWIVLLTTLVATGIAIVALRPAGIEAAAPGDAKRLRGVIVREAYGPSVCRAGVDGVQAAEDARVLAAEEGASAGEAEPRVDVSTWIGGWIGEDAAALRRARDRIARALPPDGPWTADHTRRAALDCALVLMGAAD